METKLIFFSLEKAKKNEIFKLSGLIGLSPVKHGNLNQNQIKLESNSFQYLSQVK